MFGKNGGADREIRDLEVKLEQLRGSREQFAKKHVEAVEARRVAVDTSDLSTLDKLSSRVSTIEQSLLAIDQGIESASVALANAQGRLAGERARADAEAKAKAIEAHLGAVRNSHGEFAAAAGKFIATLKAGRQVPQTLELSTFLTRFLPEAAQSVEMALRELQAVAGAERNPPPKMPEPVPQKSHPGLSPAAAYERGRGGFPVRP